MIETLDLDWTAGKEINTRYGLRILKTASPTPAFWAAWRANKTTLKDEGVEVDKPQGVWTIKLWTDPSTPADFAPAPLPVAPTPIVHPAVVDMAAEMVKAAIDRVWSDEQKAIFSWFGTGTGNLVIGARAGTGKTSTITEAFKYAYEAAILYAVFNKKNQLEAREKISDGRVEIKTLHSLGFFYIQQVWRGVKPDDSVERARIEAVCPGIDDEVAGVIERLVGFAKNCLLFATRENLEQLANDKGIFVVGEAAEIWTDAKVADAAFKALELAKERDSEGRISFNDMVWLPVVKNWVFPRFNLGVIDEAQDMNLPQLEMAVRAVHAGGRVVIVGDDRQAIYAFRGAAQDGMRMMQERLSAAKLTLTTTYRCPKAVVAIANEIVPDYVAAPTAPEGQINETTRELMVKTAKVGDAILSRLNAPLMIACLQLLREGTAARIEGRDIGRQLVGMVRKLKAKSVPDFFKKLNSWADKQRARLGNSKKSENKIAQVNDQVATLEAVAEGASSVLDIERKITSLFADSDGKAKPAVVLSSVHKAKGLEWDNTFLLAGTFRPNGDTEEQNIYYVAVTRAKKSLTFVVD